MIKIVVLPSANNRGHIQIMDDDKVISTVTASRGLDGKYEVETTMSSGASHKFTQKDGEGEIQFQPFPGVPRLPQKKVIHYYFLEGRATRLDSENNEIPLTDDEFNRWVLEEQEKMVFQYRSLKYVSYRSA